MKDIDDTKQPLLDHLVELRRRLLWCLVTLVVTFAICFEFSHEIFAILVQPLLRAGQGKLIYTDVFEAFFTQVKVAFFAALMLSFPVIATQLWRFVAPGLYAKEKNAFLPFLLATPVLFAAGACFAYFVAMPWALHFLLSFQGNVGGIEQEALPGVGNYLKFVTHLLFGFGAAFLLPMLLMILERAGIVTPRAARPLAALRDRRRSRRRRRADAARRRFDDDPDGAALRAVRIRDPGDPHHALARGAERAQARRLTQWLLRRPRQEEGPETPPGGGRVGGSGPI